ncbi:NYN domain-containing protein [Comamonas suwonensis]|uniref:NYN domain-containing protein n=1 Tax=Comamonas suwonensis TaxID=2606214 RepID=UPI00145F1948|nr:hypothetical protein [Comamonas suwonensis]MBI1624765.1 hypothetical protein [Comamonas suwonensis]
MISNPFTKNLEALQRERNKSNLELLDWKTKIAWFQGFNLDRENSNLRHAERMASGAQAKLHQAQQGMVGPASSVQQLELQAALGFNPRYWFSSERAVAKRMLMEAQQGLAAQKSMLTSAEIEFSKAAELGRKIQSEIAMARAFDPLLAQSAIAALKANLDRIEPQLASLRQRSNDLDEIMREPLENIRKQEAERDMVMSRISLAEAFDSSLSNASSSYERAKIHEQCDIELGDSKPGNVLRQSRSALRSIDDRIRKLQARVDSLIRFATWDIRHIVIDGNNLCYEGKRFLRLAALEALIPVLVRKYKVTLIFDASIRRKLELNTRDIEARFPQVEQVHIVASKRTADETVLAAAGDDPHTFVLSNDRFVDYPEKMVVKEDRVLRHEIVGQTAYIHELRIAARFEITQDIEAA